MKTSVIIEIRDGAIQFIGSDHPDSVRVVIVDHDNLEAERTKKGVNNSLGAWIPQESNVRQFVQDTKNEYYKHIIQTKR